MTMHTNYTKANLSDFHNFARDEMCVILLNKFQHKIYQTGKIREMWRLELLKSKKKKGQGQSKAIELFGS